MRKTFLRAGFLKEAHYRLGWPTKDGGHVASVAYSILRHDRETGTRILQASSATLRIR